jgi:hypothetical protein
LSWCITGNKGKDLQELDLFEPDQLEQKIRRIFDDEERRLTDIVVRSMTRAEPGGK